MNLFTQVPHPHSTVTRPGFSGHETFPFRYTWLKKAHDRVRQDACIFTKPEAMTLFGTGKNMVASIRHWALATGVVEEDPAITSNRGRTLRTTDFGDRLFADDGWDPYLEDPATLWLLHWRIATNAERCTTWYWAFNRLSMTDFERRDLVAALLVESDKRAWKRVSPTSLKRDVDCFIRTYVAARPSKRSFLEDTLDCPLTELRLVEGGPRPRQFSIRRRNPTSLPAEVFGYALVEFLERSRHGHRTVSLDELMLAPGAPGRVFCLTEDGVLERLEKLRSATDGGIDFDETAGLKQLLVRRPPSGLELLASYYAKA